MASPSEPPIALDDEPAGFVVLVEPGDRIHFLDWGGEGRPPVILVHGLSGTSLVWSPVARRLVARRRAVAMDLRGHGLSDAPTEPGAYDLDVLASDVVAVGEGSGALVNGLDGTATAEDNRVVIVGLGFGAIVAAVAATQLAERCAALVLVDGGLTNVAATSGVDVEEFLRGIAEPPEVLRSMTAYLADRRGWDPGSWDADQERAARASVVETPAGRLVPVTRPHVFEACVEAMFGYDPVTTLAAVRAPIVAIRRRTRGEEIEDEPDVPVPVHVVELDAPGHNLLRYRPDEVTAAILGATRAVDGR